MPYDFCWHFCWQLRETLEKTSDFFNGGKGRNRTGINHCSDRESTHLWVNISLVLPGFSTLFFNYFIARSTLS